ncbi:MAG: LTA synthase family protein [Spirochaetes bacterium]|nr:LTA synthase family protein [Spirochaetota bacterium]MBN2769906.1 LTA synthase family protein [Spirochaetota bacterium]
MYNIQTLIKYLTKTIETRFPKAHALIAGLRNFLKRKLLDTGFFDFRFGGANIAVTLIQFYYFIYYQFGKDMPRFRFTTDGFIELITSFLSINLLLLFISCLLSKLPRLKAGIDIFIVWLYYQLMVYQAEAKNTLDFTLVFDNIDITFTTEAYEVIFGSLSISSYIVSFLIIVFLIFLQIRNKSLTESVQKSRVIFKLGFTLTAYFMILFFQIPTRDNIAFFFQSMIRHSMDNAANIKIEKGTYPFFKSKIQISDTVDLKRHSENRPSIIFIMIESFNASVINGYTEDGKEITPNFNRLTKEGLYIPHFYGNSIQTCKGQYAAFFSGIPSYKGKVFVHYKKNDFISIASILKNNGYRTLFYQAYRRLHSDNTAPFLSSNGFEKAITADPHNKEGNPVYPSKERQTWGIEDSEFYKRFLKYAETELSDGKPFFAVLMTIVNHRNFNNYPEEKWHMHKNPRTIREHYHNSVHNTDKALGFFIDSIRKSDKLKNSIIIISGDHSYPLGDHGIVGNENGYYEESFRIPFLVLHKGNIKPVTLDKTAFSQLDIAPSICDLLAIENESNAFQGISFFSFPGTTHPIPLIQPYSGRYLSIVVHPWKYIYHHRTGREYLFNLDNDPEENNDLSSKKEYSQKKEDLRKHLKTIYINQTLLEKNIMVRTGN